MDAPGWARCQILLSSANESNGARVRCPRRYVHLSGRDINNAYERMHGLYESEDEGDKPEEIKCDRCRELNEPDAKFCMRCGFTLDQETAGELEARVDSDLNQDYRDTDPEDADTMAKLETLDELLNDSEIKTALLEKMDSST